LTGRNSDTIKESDMTTRKMIIARIAFFLSLEVRVLCFLTLIFPVRTPTRIIIRTMIIPAATSLVLKNQPEQTPRDAMSINKMQ
jgi:hypothetical protein